MNRLKDKSVIITGAAWGIGRAAAELFCDEGARVAILDVDEAAGSEIAAALRNKGRHVLFCRTDITQEDDVEAAVARVVQEFGRLDVLYNNAGKSTAADGPITKVSIEEFWRTISLNLFGTWLCSRSAIPHLINAGGGSIINTVSIAALMGLRGLDAFTAAKGAVAALTRSMAVEFAPQKIRVNAIAPTMILTERVRSLMDRSVSKDTEAINLLGPGEPVEVAHLAVYLASDESRITTGQIFPIDSGALVS